jgi:phosphatidylserine/phosphatidylglycerophosphate/cardiolipin synthase-like enzyme
LNLADWFLTSAERDNQATGLDRRHEDGKAWTIGNRVEPLVDGATYFASLLACIRELGPGDRAFIADWRGDPDERLDDSPGSELATVFAAAARRGVVVRGLIWRSHMDMLHLSARENRRLGDDVNEAGGQILLDQRVRIGGSHHQKVVLLRHPREPERDVAFVGGIDLGYGRRDDASHRGDTQVFPMAKVYGRRPAWHDLQLAVRGPAVGDVDFSFRERWEDRAPLSRNPVGIVRDRVRHEIRKAEPLPEMLPDPPGGGAQAVQVLRTYPYRRHGYPFAPLGERSVARAYGKAIGRARRLIYLEDQFFWSVEVGRSFAAALRRAPDLHVVAVVPRFFGQDSPTSDPPNNLGRDEIMDMLSAAGKDRVHLYDLENHEGMPVYVHAKVMIVDDVWACVGSANLNRRSWSHDSEMTCAVLDERLDSREPADPAGLGDGARRFARDLRLQLWREHLDRGPGDDQDLIEPASGIAAFQRTAEALAGWHEGGRREERPPGRVQPHATAAVSRIAKLWARPVYRLFYDPDGRPRSMKRKGTW